MEAAVFILNLLIDLGLLLLLLHRKAHKWLPWFICYIAWQVLAGCILVALSMIGKKAYAIGYWWIEWIELALIAAAMRESFLSMFDELRRKAGFRLLVWSAISAVIVYSILKAIHAPPIQTDKSTISLFGFEFLFRSGVIVIAFIATMLSLLPEKRMHRPEDAVLAGFGIASLGVLLFVVWVSVFRDKGLFLTKYLPTVAYFTAAGFWIRGFIRPIHGYGLKESGFTLDGISKALSQYGDDADEIMRTKW